MAAISIDGKWFIPEQMVLPIESVGVIERKVFFGPGPRAGKTNLFFSNEFDELTKAYYLDELYAAKVLVSE